MSILANKVKAEVQHRTGQAPACAPAPATTPMSWGAACPSGMCTAADLATNLNRQFAGERYPCRELAYPLRDKATAAGLLTLQQNSLVTICPTRVLVTSDDLLAIPAAAVMTAFIIGNQNQMVGDPIPISVLSPGSYQIIPYVTDCIRSGMPFALSFTGLTPDVDYTVVLIGPAIG